MCIHTYIYIYLSTHTFMYTYTHTHVHTYTHTYVRTYVHTYIRTYIQIYTCVCSCSCNSLSLSLSVSLYVCMHVCMKVCTYVCMYACTYIYICMYIHMSKCLAVVTSPETPATPMLRKRFAPSGVSSAPGGDRCGFSGWSLVKGWSRGHIPGVGRTTFDSNHTGHPSFSTAGVYSINCYCLLHDLSARKKLIECNEKQATFPGT